MPGYTLLSGIKTESITSRCPTCLKIYRYERDDPTLQHILNPPKDSPGLTDKTVCCSDPCYRTYLSKLFDMAGRASVWSRTKEGHQATLLCALDEIGIIESYLRCVGV